MPVARADSALGRILVQKLTRKVQVVYLGYGVESINIVDASPAMRW